MMWNLPTAVEIDGKEYAITNKCDYRMVLDVICALNDSELDDEQKLRTALYIFYEDISECTDIEKAIKEVMLNSNLDCCEGYTLKRNSKQVFDEERFAKEHPKSYEGYLIDKVEVKLSKNIKEDD